jgi:hypothetical protein
LQRICCFGKLLDNWPELARFRPKKKISSILAQIQGRVQQQTDGTAVFRALSHLEQMTTRYGTVDDYCRNREAKYYRYSFFPEETSFVDVG